MSHDIDLPNEYSAANSHGDSNDGEVHTRKVERVNTYMFPSEDVSPKQTCE
jgi:hypothetical protein